jgi:hypothetical protein
MRYPLALVIALLMLLGAPYRSQAQNVLFVVDFSGSMNEKVGDRTKIAAAKEVFRSTVGELSSSTRIGLMLYGHRRAKDCKDIEVLARLGERSPQELADQVDKLHAMGETPIATALLQSLALFQGHKGEKNSIVLITDGREECNGDPCAATSALEAGGVDVKVDVVGFKLSSDDRATLDCISKLSGGQYFDAQDAAGLKTALAQVKQAVVAAEPAPQPAPPPKPERLNLLLPKNGGELIFSPSEGWAYANDDKLDRATWFVTGEEAVFGFKDGQSANMQAFATYLPAADGCNPKTIELSTGDEGPTGAFKPLTTVTTVNGKLRDGWQEAKLPAATAKYLKIKLVAPHSGKEGNELCLYEFRLYGELAKSEDAAPAASNEPPAARLDILSAKNGGSLIFSPSEGWAYANDGKFDRATWFVTGEEAVFGFKDGMAGKMNAFATYLPLADGCNPKTVELSTGDDGPTGAFKPLATVTTVNGKLRDGWQEAKLPATTAKYLKIKMTEAHSGKEGNELCLYEFRLYGELTKAEGGAPAAASESAPTSRTNLLSAKNGGSVALSPSEGWAYANDDKLDRATWFQTGEEAVFGFKDGMAANMSAFATYLPVADGCNPKTIELSTGDEGPTGAFKPLATVTTINGKLRDGWQEAKLPAATAKYLKIKMTEAHSGKEGNELCLYEFRLYGELTKAENAAAAAPATSEPGPSSRVNLLSAKNGGSVILSPSEGWAYANDDKLDRATWFQTGEEAVFGFKDEGQAQFDGFAVYLPVADGCNPKTIELSTNDEGPTAEFKPLATMTTVNGKLRDGWQELKLPSTTAKYLKTKLVAAHSGKEGNELCLYEFRLYGALK